ncbi:serine hydrolase domain-containing protein [Streptomyces sp. NPDC003036]|uniref:serine hydrolase domain-containing protein n=1 Tax=Streptomyces sp. NPDC003036 TaxID=3154442 RepID=UPI0033A3753B
MTPTGLRDDTEVRARLDEAVRAMDAPDTVVAYSRDGRRTVRCGGTAPPGPVPRDLLRYELGSASKPYTGLLLAELVRSGALSGDDPAVAHLDPGHRGDEHGRLAAITLTHLITHTAGLPPLPRDFYRQALPHWTTNPYAGYPPERVVRAFLRSRPRHRPGTRWRYSNFGVAVLGHTLAAATATSWEELLTGRVLRPLGLTDTALRPEGPGTDATGHKADAATSVPPLVIGGFQSAGAVRTTPYDALAFVEAHLRPAATPLAEALGAVLRPVLRRGWGHRHVHTLTWFRHPTDEGPLYFHAGATSGQQAFIGFRPDTGTALAAFCTRRHRGGDPFVTAAYALLQDPP